MELLSKSELQALIEVAEEPCVSMYLPTHVAGPEIRQDPIQLKNVLQEAEQQLQDRGLRQSDIDSLLAPARGLLDQERFWRYQSQGLALFLTPEGMRTYRLPLDFSPMAFVGSRFQLKPLMDLFAGDRYFYILALSQQMVKLFQATQHQISEIPLEGFPMSLDEALKYDDPEEQLRFHRGAGGNRPPVYHGQGVGTNEDKDAIRRFFDKVNKGLHPYLNQETAPLVIASVEFLQPIYKEVSSYPHITEQGVNGNPEHVQPDDLHQQSWSIIEPMVERSQQQALGQYAELHNTDQTGSRIEQIVPAAYNGQIDTLFVVKDAHSWGQYDPATSTVRAKNAESDDAIDLLDLAAVRTLLQGGTVYTLPMDDMPEPTSAVAIYRYEIPVAIHS